MSTTRFLKLSPKKDIFHVVLSSNELMKITVNATITDPRSSGLGIYTVNVVRELSLFTSSITVFTSTPEFFPKNGVLLRRVGSFVRPSYGLRGHVARILWSHFQLRKYLKESDASVLLSPTPLESIFNSPVPQVVVVHDLVPLFFHSHHRRQKHFFRFILPRILRTAARVITDSRSTKEDLVQAYDLPEENINVVYLSHDRETLAPTEAAPDQNDQPYVLYVGNLYPHKNLHRLLEAFKVASQEIPHELIIVGYQDPRFYPSLYDMAQRLEILKRVKFLNYVPRDRLASLYGAADVFVFPSLYEGFGIPPLEAMACGTPVVASTTKAVQEVLGDAAEFADPSDVSAIANALTSVVCSDSKKEDLRAKGFERVKLYSWKKSAQEVYRILSEVDATARIN